MKPSSLCLVPPLEKWCAAGGINTWQLYLHTFISSSASSFSFCQLLLSPRLLPSHSAARFCAPVPISLKTHQCSITKSNQVVLRRFTEELRCEQRHTGIRAAEESFSEVHRMAKHLRLAAVADLTHLYGGWPDCDPMGFVLTHYCLSFHVSQTIKTQPSNEVPQGSPPQPTASQTKQNQK